MDLPLEFVSACFALLFTFPQSVNIGIERAYIHSRLPSFRLASVGPERALGNLFLFFELSASFLFFLWLELAQSSSHPTRIQRLLEVFLH
jgi:hypothetical protein